MNKRYTRRHNPKKIALIIEIVLLVAMLLVFQILEGVGIKINYIPIIIITSVLLFALLLTLSLIRYDSLREIRSNFKDTNLPLYTDPTALLGHDIKDEEERNKD